MKRLTGVVGVMVVLVGVSFLATHQFGDRELFTSPPEAVAEEFYRQIVMHRFDQAIPLLADPVEPETLRPLAAGIESRLGHVDEVSAETVSRTDTEALVTVRLRSKEGSDALFTALVFERARWKLIQSRHAGGR